MFGFSASKSSTIRLIELYSKDWLAGGGGVYPIHIVSSTGPPEVGATPVELPLLLPLSEPPPVHATAMSSTATGNTSLNRLMPNLPLGRELRGPAPGS